MCEIYLYQICQHCFSIFPSCLQLMTLLNTVSSYMIHAKVCFNSRGKICNILFQFQLVYHHVYIMTLSKLSSTIFFDLSSLHWQIVIFSLTQRVCWHTRGSKMTCCGRDAMSQHVTTPHRTNIHWWQYSHVTKQAMYHRNIQQKSDVTTCHHASQTYQPVIHWWIDGSMLM